MAVDSNLRTLEAAETLRSAAVVFDGISPIVWSAQLTVLQRKGSQGLAKQFLLPRRGWLVRVLAPVDESLLEGRSP